VHIIDLIGSGFGDLAGNLISEIGGGLVLRRF
jgi:hypothetical protein